MSDLINVADQVKAGAKRLEWVTNLANALEQVGSLEQAEQEAKVRLEDVQGKSEEAGKELEALQSAMKEATEQLNLRRAEAKRAVSDAQSRANQIIDSADAQAKAAVEQASSIVTSAKKEAEDLLVKARRETGAETDRLNGIQGQVRDAEAQLHNVKEEIAKAKAEAAALFKAFGRG